MKRTALVTGGGQGIGRGIVETLIARGWRVLALDRDKEALRELADAYPADALLTVAADVGSERAVAERLRALRSSRQMAEAQRRTGRSRSARQQRRHRRSVLRPIEKLSLAKWRTWIDSHLTGAFLCTRAAVPRLRKRDGASIVNMASTRAFQSEPHTEAYAASKGALVAFTHALAISEGPAIRANVICPGWIETAQYKKVRRAQRAETSQDRQDATSGRPHRHAGRHRAGRALSRRRDVRHRPDIHHRRRHDAQDDLRRLSDGLLIVAILHRSDLSDHCSSCAHRRAPAQMPPRQQRPTKSRTPTP